MNMNVDVRIGKVTDVNKEKRLVRVKFEDTGITSGWLPVMQHYKAIVYTEEAGQQYISWQSGKMGRDINPDKLRYLLLEVGIKRVDLQQPVFTPLEDGKPSVDLTSDKVPQVAKVGTVTVKSGGYEDE